LKIEVSANASDLDAARALVANALSVTVDQIDPETQMYDIPTWDSFGQVSVILAVEEARNVQITDESLFRMLTSVSGIARYIARTSE
jgi:acyl carrier protein